MKGNIHYGEVDISPQEAGYRPEMLEKLNALLDGLVESGKLQGASYMMSRGGRIFASRAAGRLRPEADSPPFTTASIRRIASITKLFTAVCILRLLEDGHLYLKQPVSDFIAEFKEKPFDQIQVYHLLTHTSGIRPDPGYFLEPYPAYWGDWAFAFDEEDQGEAEDGIKRRSRWIKAILAGPPRCEPGAEWHYSTAGYTFLGEIIRRVTGMPYADFFNETIFKPLGLDRTFYQVPEALHGEVCIINAFEANRLARKDGSDDPPSTGGGLFSTLGDLHRFGLMLMNGGTWDGVRILGRKSVELLQQNQFPDGIYAYHWGEDTPWFQIGLGATIGRTAEPFRGSAFGHEGAGRCMMLVDPAEQFAAVYFVPSNEDWLPESIISVRTMMWAGLV